ncbi:Z-DNA-binding protein 1 isoform X2 [Sturnira hondurensis]|uniref:Z-DNA-binding protein 1 isoform X2 n=1 Tax=Sturnira hondurensis TaxID=192404 RepID=UPI00187966D2|nr:Z-DNA-binding protein 1 isoform X2 [Sturnira hondurensis]
MDEASADPDLEQKILQVLRVARSPVKTAQLVKDCQVPKKKLNQVLYRMKKESRVALTGPATWQLGGPGTGELVGTELALARSADRPRQLTVAAPLKLNCQLSKQQEAIYRFLEANGPSKALIVAQSLGLKTAKEVNPDLYALRNKHLLHCDQNSNAWAIYQPEDSRERSQATSIIYQQSPINMICQNGPNSHISIENSEAIQIGHGNSIVRQTARGDNSSTAPLCFPPLAPADPSTQDPLAASWGSQDIHLEKSVLRRVQMGHGNEMSLPDVPATRPDRSPFVSSFSVSPPVSATPADPEASFEIRMPTPGPQTEGDGDMTQRVLMKSCFLEDATIGNGNRMHVSPGKAGPEDSSDSGEPAGEPADGKAPRSEAAEPRGKVPQEGRQADPDMATVTDHLEALTLERRDPDATEDGPLVD